MLLGEPNPKLECGCDDPDCPYKQQSEADLLVETLFHTPSYDMKEVYDQKKQQIIDSAKVPEKGE